ncbi:uncharacterized protein (DUF1501 family) [Sphingomonas sp. BE138]|uniref:DUF1501 domain-containing protein n=1 Tax=Sphingomonas sp. BE138 TaxID=2817845 RepID=UPI00285F4C2A|nr:DUF1501 domain-containing protein [Sphingomonas sp. BE138]MDR6788478.1 uncharacterized protein (DUF1501 family) [Sphingomonas sp. BE138]
MTSISRRHFHHMAMSAGAAAALGMFGRGVAYGAPGSGFRAMVGVFLFGGNDGWNMLVPTDPAAYSAYVASRQTVALPPSAVVPLAGSGLGLHQAMASLAPIWDAGAMALVLNAGTLAAPLTKATFVSRPDLRPSNLMSHSDEQEHWQGLRAQGVNRDGFMGRLHDRMGAGSGVPPVISFAGNNVALIGQQAQPLVLPSRTVLTRADSGNPAIEAAVSSFAGGTGLGDDVTQSTAETLKDAYAMTAATSAVLSATGSVEAFFVNPSTGAALTSEVAMQLKRVARMIEARSTFGHGRQSFFVSQGGYDTHDNQVTGGNVAAGTHANLLGDLALALAAFYKAMQSLGLQDNVTTFTMSDFGRTYRGNAQFGSDHAWGNNHLVIGGGVTPKGVFGRYPDPTLGGADDISNEGRFLPTMAQEEYLGAILKWHGVADGDMPYVVPNWGTWSTNGRGPIGLYG